MGRVNSNSVANAITKEASYGVLPGTPDVRYMEPNEISSFGANETAVQRTPITKSRQRRKGTPTKRESPFEVGMDLTYAIMAYIADGFVMALPQGAPFYRPSAVVSGGYTVPALSAADAAKFLYGATDATTLVQVRGCGIAANNGTFPITGAVSTSATTIPVSGRTAETPAAPNVIDLEVGGVRGAAGDLEIDADGNLISTALNFTLLGIQPGQIVHVGGVDAANQFFTEANNNYARVLTVAQNKLTFDKRWSTFAEDDGTDNGSGGTGLRIDLLFGRYIRTVDTDSANYVEPSYQAELTSPNLGSAGQTMYEYAPGLYCDALSLNWPETDKITMTMGMMGKDVTEPSTTRTTGFSGARNPNAVAAFSSTLDVARVRIADTDDTGISTDFKTLTLTLGNNVSGEWVLGQITPKYMNVGMLDVGFEAEAIFTTAEIIDRIRDNDTITFDSVVRNAEGAIAFDIPALTLSGGGRSFPQNESVKISLTGSAHKDATYGSSLSVSFFPISPPDHVH